jgi:hypothetical protein
MPRSAHKKAAPISAALHPAKHSFEFLPRLWILRRSFKVPPDGKPNEISGLFVVGKLLDAHGLASGGVSSSYFPPQTRRI